MKVKIKNNKDQIKNEYMKKKNINFNNNITDYIEFNDSDILYNTPVKIKYNKYYFNITTRNYSDKSETT